MALPFMPQEHIVPIFVNLQAGAVTDQLRELASYIEATWVRGTVWTPANWSVYMQSIRTNNDIEGWHRRLNFNGRHHMPLYHLVRLLEHESELITAQIRLVSEKKLQRLQRKAYAQLQRKLFDAWYAYQAGTKSAIALLRTCSHLYGPTDA